MLLYKFDFPRYLEIVKQGPSGNLVILSTSDL